MNSKLKSAYELHVQKKYTEAQRIYLELEKENPNEPNVLQLLGALYLETGDLDKSQYYLLKAEKELPHLAQIKNNLSLISKKQGNLKSAYTYLEEAIKCNPDFYDAHYNLATLFFADKKYEESIIGYSKAEKINNKDPKVNNNKGVAYQKIGDIRSAEKEFLKAIKKNNSYSEPVNNLANLLKNSNYKKAKEYYLKAIKIEEKYEYIDNYLNLLIQNNKIDEAEYISSKYKNNINDAIFEVKIGVIEAKKKNKEKAIYHYMKALDMDPKVIGANKNIGLIYLEEKKFNEAYQKFCSEALITNEYADNLFDKANALMGMNKCKEAFDLYKECIELKPLQIEYINNYGSALYSANKFEEAIVILEQAILINDNFLMAYVNLAQCYERLFNYKKAASIYEKALNKWPKNNEIKAKLFLDKRYMCEWSNYDALLNAIKQGIGEENFPMVPFAALSFFDDPDLVLKSTKGWIKDRFKMDELKSIEFYNNEKIKIAYFSPDFKNHPVSYLISSLFAKHDRMKFEVYAFGYGPIEEDYFHKKIIAGVDKFIDINLITDHEAAILCRDLKIDIAIDLAGYTQNCRTELFKLRVAPIQTSYLGFVGSMGLEQYDYLIADKVIIPESLRGFYPEKIMYLDNYQCNDNERSTINFKLSKNEFGLPDDGFVFCCFNNSYKITPIVFKTWMEILEKVSGSVLFLYSENEWQIENLKSQAIHHNINPDRLIFSGKIPIAKYLARFELADLFLDTNPYNAGTTCSDALWAELPVITFLGNSFPARMAASILNACEMQELICKDLSEYKEKAINIALDKRKYNELKSKLLLKKQASNLFNIDHYRLNLEHVYIEAYNKFKNNMPAADIDSLGNSNLLLDEALDAPTFLHVGCGTYYKEQTIKEFFNWNEIRYDDNETGNPDFLGSMTDLNLIPTHSVDAIYTSKSLVHLFFYEVPLALNEFRRVLKAEGFVVINCHDIQAICALIAEDKKVEIINSTVGDTLDPIEIIYGNRKNFVDAKLSKANRSGFTEKYLRNILIDSGFKKVATMKRGAPYFDMWALATKADLLEEELLSLARTYFTTT